MITHSLLMRKPGPVAAAATFHCFTELTAQQRKSRLDTFQLFAKGCVVTWTRSRAAPTIQHYSTCTKGYGEANLLWGTGNIWVDYKELCDLQNEKKEGVVVGQDNGRLPGPTGRVQMIPNDRFPFPFPNRTVNEWTQSYSHQSFAKGENSKPSACNQTGRDSYLPCASLSPDRFNPRETLRSATLALPRLKSLHRATWPRREQQ